MNSGTSQVVGAIGIFIITVGVGGIIYQLNKNKGAGVANDVTTLGTVSLSNLYK